MFSSELQELATRTVEALKHKNLTISLAESCTGGMLATLITSISGASDVLNCGIVCYSNQSKITLVNIPQTTIKTYGAVSKETALALAENVKIIGKSDIGLSVTGIAGPTGGTKDKPVGTVYIGLAHKTSSYTHYQLSGDRHHIREETTKRLLEILEQQIIT